MKKIQWEHLPYEYDSKTKMLRRTDEDELTEEDITYIDDVEGSPIMGELVSTPWGLFHVDNELHPFRIFELWMGDTNFDITEDIAMILNKIPGVEALIIVTRYKFLIGIGKLFTMKEVRRAIEKELCDTKTEDYRLNTIDNEEIRTKVKKEIDSLRINAKCWALCLLSNGEYEIIKDEEYDNMVKIYRKASLASPGVMLFEEDNR